MTNSWLQYESLLDSSETVPANLAEAKLKQGNNDRSFKDEKEILKEIDVNLLRGKLVGIIGPVGSGKSVLLRAILRQKPSSSNNEDIMSYAAQESWIFPKSVRQNILFGEEMDRERYMDVTKSCALAKDFKQFENGDRTIIGERGASLSGGQKARIK